VPTYSDGAAFAHSANFLKWIAPFVGKPVWGLEIGSHEGRSALWMMDNILTHPQSGLTCVDTWEGEEVQKAEGMDFALKERNFLDNTRAYRESGRLIVRKGDSARIVRILAKRYNFAYVDGSHVAPDVLIDAINVWNVLSPGGVMIFDDYLWARGGTVSKRNDEPLRGPRTHVNDEPCFSETHKPKLAIDAFLSVFRERIEVLDKGYQVAVRKVV
jgi:predicted O-methyltransferase YrrM